MNSHISSPSPSPSPSVLSKKNKTSETEIPTHTLYNLCLLDPPQYGWMAHGGISNILEPHEKANRSSTKERYLIQCRIRQRQKQIQRQLEKKGGKKKEQGSVQQQHQLRKLAPTAVAAPAFAAEIAQSQSQQHKGGKTIGSASSSNDIATVATVVDIAAAADAAVATVDVYTTNTNGTAKNTNTNVTTIDITHPNNNTSKAISTSTIKTRNKGLKIPFTNSGSATHIGGGGTSYGSGGGGGHNVTASSLPPSSTKLSAVRGAESGRKRKRKKKEKKEILEFTALILNTTQKSGSDDITINDPNQGKNKQLLLSSSEAVTSSATAKTTVTSTTKTTEKEQAATRMHSNNKLNHETSNAIAKTTKIVASPSPITNDNRHDDKSDKDQMEQSALFKNAQLNPYIYHRGIENQEPRDDHTGALLCPTIEPMDTNHDWDEPKLKFAVNIRFPLVDTDGLFHDKNDEEEEKKEQEQEERNHKLKNDKETSNNNIPQPRRNARRSSSSGNSNTNFKKESLLSRRLRREAKIKSLPHMEQTIQWDLSDIKYSRTPLIYASDIAVEYGLSLNQTLDLARSIQEQIDDHVRNNIKYNIPISTLDSYLYERNLKEGPLQPPKYRTKVLYGGHGATNILSGVCAGNKGKVLDDDEFDSDSENGKHPSSHQRHPKSKQKQQSNKGRRRLTKKVSGSKRRSSSSVITSRGTASRAAPNRKEYALPPKDQLPHHDFNKFVIEEKYVKETLIRMKAATKEHIRSMQGTSDEEARPLGTPYLVKNHNCHICHVS